MLHKAILAGIIILCVVTGCESQSENKGLAQMRWQKASAYAKLNFAEQQYQSEQFEQALKTVSECVTTNPDMRRKLICCLGNCCWRKDSSTRQRVS